VEVATAAGRVRGRWEGPVAVFRGIPFAAPPVGPHRFAAPQPVVAWDGVRDASRFGPAPPQPALPTGGDDWLNLTVWTPDPGRAGLPVLLWISGGGYLNCDAANPHFAGDGPAAAGAVAVSAHYRTGAEGLLRIPGFPDNRALLDQLAALEWVHANIAAFGGDPGNVTMFGQSAGAGSIAALLAMPSAAGAFRRAILQSIPGTYFTPGLADDVAAEIGRELGRPPTAADPEALVAATRAVTDRLVHSADRWGAVVFSSTQFSPVVDGATLPEPPWAPVRELLDLAVFLDAPARVRLPGLVRRQRARGLDAAGAEDWVHRSDEANARLIEATRGADPFRAPEGPMASHVSCASNSFRFDRPLTIKWTLRYR